MKTSALVALLLLAAPCFAMKSHHENFPQSCDVVWKASVAVAKRQEYRIISVSKEEQIISLAAGGIWWGERIISLSLEPGAERGCTVTVQSRYSGVQHSDGPDLLGRIHVQLVGDELGRETKAFLKFQDCVENSRSNEAKCETKFRQRLAEAESSKPTDPSTMWNIQKP